MALLNRVFRSGKDSARESSVSGTDLQHNVVGDGDLKYTIEQGGNGSSPSYQEISGAPVETNSPLGYSVGRITVVFLNISMMIGTGVYSTR